MSSTGPEKNPDAKATTAKLQDGASKKEMRTLLEKTYEEWLWDRESQRMTPLTSPHGQANDLIDTRAHTHGEWWLTSLGGQKLKEALRGIPGYDRLTPKSKESLEMIQVKIARIISGSEFYPDHWRDIAGYAMLNVGAEDEPKG